STSLFSWSNKTKQNLQIRRSKIPLLRRSLPLQANRLLPRRRRTRHRHRNPATPPSRRPAKFHCLLRH
uniref:Uncharacterized protein n=1 Tax=Cucumis melo TaxID=3656 RepID=A0A9I9EIF9_CUCME